MSNQVNLAMPFGLPEAEGDILNHYQRLEEETTLEQLADNTVRIFNTNAPEWSSIHTICRCIAVVLPAGSTAPDEAALSQAAVLIKPWFWDFLQMSESGGDGLLPSKIVYKNIDADVLRNDIRQEITTNERYASLSEAEKSSLQDQFLRGEVKILLQSETKIGAGIILTTGEHSGKRSFDLQFLDYENRLINPAEVAEIYELVGGRTVNNHPFAKHFSIAVWPNIAPLEGGLRFKVSGLPFIEGTRVTVGGNSVPENKIRLSPNKEILYGEIPSNNSNDSVNVIVAIPGITPSTFADAISYKTGLLDAIRSTVISYVIHLQEIKFLIDEELSKESLTPERKQNWLLEIDKAGKTIDHTIFLRSENGGGSLGMPDVNQVWENSAPLIREFKADILNILHG